MEKVLTGFKTFKYFKNSKYSLEEFFLKYSLYEKKYHDIDKII